MPLCLRATANDTIGTVGAVTNISQAVTTQYSLPATLSLALTCKNDEIEIDGNFILQYTATVTDGPVGYIDQTIINIYQGTTATGTPVYTTGTLQRTHNRANAGTYVERWIVPIQYIGNPALPVTENKVNYTITVQSTATDNPTSASLTLSAVTLQQYTVSAREIPDCDL